MFFGLFHDSISVRRYGLDHSFTEVTATAGLTRAEVFDPSEVAVLHLCARVVRRCFLFGERKHKGRHHFDISYVSRFRNCLAYDGQNRLVQDRRRLVAYASSPFVDGIDVLSAYIQTVAYWEPQNFCLNAKSTRLVPAFNA